MLQSIKIAAVAWVLASGPALACDLAITEIGNDQINVQETCDKKVTFNKDWSFTPKDKSKKCTMHIVDVEQIDHNIFYIHTKCDVSSTLIIKLQDNDVILITNAENY